MTMIGPNDPLVNFRFQVEIDGLIIAGFSEVSGLQAEIETREYSEGGVNDHVYQLPEKVKYPNLVLKRGLTDSDVLWKWHNNAVNGWIKRKNGRIILYDSIGNEIWHWAFEGAYPVKWAGPDFKADSSTTAIETLELVHNGIKKE
jgi:phage tail-like protein